MPTLRAARTLDELALLRAVTADAGDAGVRGVYRDWLDDRGDGRGAFLREFQQAFDAKDPLPADPPGCEAWADALGLPVYRRLRERADAFAPYEPYLRQILGSAQACARLTPGDAAPLESFAPGTSRAGGVPDLPRNVGWPTVEDTLCGGVWPMQFSLQVDLADLAGTLVEHLLPPAGLVSLFFYPEIGSEGVCVRYTRPGVTLRRLKPPTVYGFHPDQRGRVTFPTDMSHPLTLADTLRYADWLSAIPEDLQLCHPVTHQSPLNELSGWAGPASDGHYLATPHKPAICSQWDDDLYFGDVPRTHLELLELGDFAPALWAFGDKLHVFVDAGDARTGRFGELSGEAM